MNDTERDAELARLIHEQAVDARTGDRVWSLSLDARRGEHADGTLMNTLTEDGVVRLESRRRKRCPIHGLARMGLRNMGDGRGMEEYCRQCNLENGKRWRARQKRLDPLFHEKERKRVNEYRRSKRLSDPEWRERENAKARARYHRRKLEAQDG